MDQQSKKKIAKLSATRKLAKYIWKFRFEEECQELTLWTDAEKKQLEDTLQMINDICKRNNKL
jgi:hypothetical protein